MRRFTKKQRAALYLAANGKSEISGEPLGEGWHADHIIPYSLGGVTDVINGQALTARENRSKGASCVVLRKWQEKFVSKWQASEKDFLLSALPGSGKTIAALYAAKLFLESNRGGKIVVVVPSLNLREQWQGEAWGLFGISLQSKEFESGLKTDYDGAVVTYQTVATNSITFRSIASRQTTLVLLDEVHHAGDERQWGDAIKFAFEPASKRLCLSGTPFRTDGSPIPFVKYGPDGYCLTDYTYDYPSAIRDGVLRVVNFHHNSGRVDYIRNGVVVTGEVHQSVTEEEASRHLGKLISCEGDFAKSLMVEANKRLQNLRQYKRDAGGLVLCKDSWHALAVGKVLEEITRKKPSIVLADDEKANSSVSDYRNDSSREWVVAVRQVSEGTDIKRLMVLVYLTNTVTELFFRQAVGRIVRNEGTEWDEESYCYLPSDPRLLNVAKRITESQIAALKIGKEDNDGEEDIDGAEEDLSSCHSPQIILGTSEATPEGVIVETQEFTREEEQEIVDIARELEVSQAKAIKIKELIRRKCQTLPTLTPAGVTPKTTRSHVKPPEAQSDVLRRKINQLVSKLARVTGDDHKAIHTEYMQTVCNASQSQMTTKQLMEKLQWVEKRLAQSK